MLDEFIALKYIHQERVKKKFSKKNKIHYVKGRN
jgi:hypothetical protein